MAKKKTAKKRVARTARNTTATATTAKRSTSRAQTSTDLERHVNAPGRKQMVKQVRGKINQLGITYIYFQFVSVTGRIVGKGIPADHWERVAEKGFQLVYGSTANLFIDRHGDYIGYGPEASELVGIADPETFVQLPWDKRIARVFCTCFRNREERVNPGGHLTSDCRGNLRIIHDEFIAKHKLHMRIGTEPEMMWLKLDENRELQGGVTKPNCYHIDQFEELRPAFMRVIEYGQAMGLDMIQGDHEDAPGQLELNWMFDVPMQNSDRLTTYRQICAQVAREKGLHACFMSKPFMNVSASGCHHNVSLWSGGAKQGQPAPPKPPARHGRRVRLPRRRRQPLHAGPENQQGQTGAGGPQSHRRRHRTPEGADLHRLIHGQLLPKVVGHRFLGAGIRRLGFSEPHLRAARLGAGAF